MVVLGSGLVWLVGAGWMFAGQGWGTIAAVRSACGSSPPDVRVAPSPPATLAFIDGCRRAGGLASYRHLQVLDLAYPGIVAVFLASALWLLARDGFGAGSRLRMLALLPLAASAFDYLENTAAWTLLGGSGRAWAPQLFQAGSLGKTALSWGSWLTLLALAARWAVLARRRGAAGSVSDRLPDGKADAGLDPSAIHNPRQPPIGEWSSCPGPGGSAGAGGDEAGLVGADDGLGAVTHVQLEQHGRHV